MRLLTRLIKGLLILAALLVAGAYGALQMLDLEKIKQLAIEKVGEQTGRTLTISGTISPKLSLKPSIVIEDVSLSNPKWATNQELIAAKSITLAADLMPLFRKKVEISQISIDGASINPESSKKGVKSWDFKPNDKVKSEEPTDNADSNAKSGNNAFELSIDSIQITESTLAYKDHASGAAHALDITDLNVTDINGAIFGAASLTGRYNNAAVQVNAQLNGDLLNLETAISGDGATIKSTGTVAMTDQSFDLSLNANASQLKKLMALVGKKNNDQSAISVTTNLSGTLNMISFNNLQAIYGDTQIDGSGKLNLSKNKPYLSAKLNIPHYAASKEPVPAPPANTNNETKAPAKQAAKPQGSLPVDALGTLNADIALSIGKVALNKMDLRNVKTTIKLNQQVLTLSPLSFNTAHGSLSGAITLAGNADTPTLSIAAKTDDMKLAALVKDLSGHGQFTGGKLLANVNLKGAGHTISQALNASSGTANLYVNDATYKVPDSAKSAAQFFDLVGSEEDKNTVNVSCLVSKMKIENGVAKPDVLALKTPAAIVTGSGSINLPKSRMDMTFKARSTAAISLSDLTPPIRVQGPFNNLSYIPDPAGSVIGLGKIFLGASSGIGLAALLGEKVTDGLGITEDNNPCLMSISEELAKKEEAKPTSTKETYKQLEDDFRVKRDVIKKDGKKEFKRIEDDVRNIRDGFLGVLGK